MFSKRPKKPSHRKVSIDLDMDLNVSCSGVAMAHEGVDDLTVYIGTTDITDQLDEDTRETICDSLYQTAVVEEQHQWEAYIDDKADRDMEERRDSRH